jgi:hypothetical protein
MMYSSAAQRLGKCCAGHLMVYGKIKRWPLLMLAD